MFKSKGPKAAADKAADQDLEAGEKDDLLEKGETGDASNAEKKEGEGKHVQNALPSGLYRTLVQSRCVSLAEADTEGNVLELFF